MSNDKRSFAERHEEVGRLTRRWKVGPAYDAARVLVRDFPGEIDGYTVLNMLICITDNGGGRMGGLREASMRLIDDAMMTIPDFAGSVAHGDMLRDLMLGMARFPHGDSLALARRLATQIRGMHKADPNRLACLLDAEARMAAVKGDLEKSYKLHAEAHMQWQQLGNEADPNWVHFNLVHWLRVSIELYGRRRRGTASILEMLRKTRHAEGAHNDNQVRIICLPVVGLRAYRWLETHRM